MVRVLGHQIEVVSRPGRGSRFTVILSRVPVSALPTVAKPASTVSMDHGLEGASVLVIDNEPAVLESMAMLLSRWGCTVITATGRSQALARLDECGMAPQAILADYHLDDGQTGFDAIHAVRRHLGQDLPCAIITADRGDETRRLLRAQYLPVLNKPVKPNRLRALLTSLIASSSF